MIVNPSSFYVIDILTTIDSGFLCAGVIFIIAIVFFGYCCIDNDDTSFRKWLVVSIIGLAISVLVCVLIPSKDTMIMMEAANIATIDNMSLIFDELKETIDYIVEATK